MTCLCVNIDHIATIREARKGVEPEPAQAVALCERAGAVGITVHLREDRRHIHDHDLEALRRTVTTMLNLEMAATDEMVGIALRVRPDQVTLVPEKRQEVTTEGGLDVAGQAGRMREVVGRLQDGGIPVSMFIDPDAAQVAASAEVGARLIELHTGRYCEAEGAEAVDEELRALVREAAHARELGLVVNAGHGLNYRNVRPVAAIEGMHELNIGHSIISRSVFVGIESAVREMRELIDNAVAD